MKKKTRKIRKPKTRSRRKTRSLHKTPGGSGSLRLRIPKGDYAVAILLAQSRLNYTLTKLLCEIVAAHSLEAARTAANYRAQQQYASEGWVVAETCVTSIYE